MLPTNKTITDETRNSGEDACISPSIDDASYSTQKCSSEANEEYKDSLEFTAASKNSNRNGGVGNDGDGDGNGVGGEFEGDLFDTVEQDSLENDQIDSIKIRSNDGVVPQFYPFAQIGPNWSNESAAQNSNNNHTPEHNSSTNQSVEFETSNNTNELTHETNHNSIATNQNLIDDEYRDLPGKLIS